MIARAIAEWPVHAAIQRGTPSGGLATTASDVGRHQAGHAKPPHAARAPRPNSATTARAASTPLRIAPSMEAVAVQSPAT